MEVVNNHLYSLYSAEQSRQVGRDDFRKEANSVVRCLFKEFNVHTSSDTTDPFTDKGIWRPSAVDVCISLTPQKFEFRMNALHPA
jgi:hypothetical protein